MVAKTSFWNKREVCIDFTFEASDPDRYECRCFWCVCVCACVCLCVCFVSTCGMEHCVDVVLCHDTPGIPHTHTHSLTHTHTHTHTHRPYIIVPSTYFPAQVGAFSLTYTCKLADPAIERRLTPNARAAACRVVPINWALRWPCHASANFHWTGTHASPYFVCHVCSFSCLFAVFFWCARVVWLHAHARMQPFPCTPRRDAAVQSLPLLPTDTTHNVDVCHLVSRLACGCSFVPSPTRCVAREIMWWHHQVPPLRSQPAVPSACGASSHQAHRKTPPRVGAGGARGARHRRGHQSFPHCRRHEACGGGAKETAAQQQQQEEEQGEASHGADGAGKRWGGACDGSAWPQQQWGCCSITTRCRCRCRCRRRRRCGQCRRGLRYHCTRGSKASSDAAGAVETSGATCAHQYSCTPSVPRGGCLCV